MGSAHTHLDQLVLAQRICHRSGAFKKCIDCGEYRNQDDPETAKEYALGLFEEGDEDALFFETEERLVTAIDEAHLSTAIECACISGGTTKSKKCRMRHFFYIYNTYFFYRKNSI